MPKEEANCLIRAGQLHPSLSTDFTEVDLLSQENLYIYYPFLVFSFIILVPYGIYEKAVITDLEIYPSPQTSSAI